MIPRHLLALSLAFSFWAIPCQAQTTSGKVVAWGDNSLGQTNVPPTATNVVAVAAGFLHSLALRSDGTVIGWGDNSYGQVNVPAGLTNVTAIAAGDYHGLALKRDGTVLAWGDNSEGQLAVPSDLSNVVSIAAGRVHSLALKQDGTVVAWGTSVPAGLSDVVAIAADASHSIALKKDGTLVAWGDGATIPANLSNVVAVAGCGEVSLALKSDGTLVLLWGGANGFGQNDIPAGLKDVIAIDGAGDVRNGNYGYSLALKSDGNITGWGWNGYGQTQIPSGLTNVLALAAGADHVLALVNNSASPSLLWNPVDQTVSSGTDPVLRVGVVGTFPLSFHWLREGTNFGITSNAWLTITNVQPANAGRYSVIATNAFGSVLSSNASLTVLVAPPSILIQPTGGVVASGSNATVTAKTAGSLPMSFQWKFNETDIAGATSLLLTLNNLQLTNEGNYRLAITNAYGSEISSNAYINVVDLAEALSTTNMVWTTGGDSPWFVETNSTVRGIAAVESGSLLPSQQSWLQTTVTGPGVLTFWWKTWSDITEGSGSFLGLYVNGVEHGRIGHIRDWYQAANVYLAEGPQVLRWVSQRNDAWGYNAWVDEVAFSPGGTPPSVTLSPNSQVQPVTSNATFTASVLGTPPFGYQWQFNQTNIPGAVASTLTLTNLRLLDEGDYAVTVTNAFGMTDSTSAFLNVVDSAEALNATNLTWSSTGPLPWFPQTGTTHDGVAALQSGAVSLNQQSTAQTVVTGPARLSFWWKITSAINNDFVTFSVDGVEQARITGVSGWLPRTFYLGAGSHSLTWTYSKLNGIVGSMYAGWLDELSVVPGGTPPFLVAAPVSQSISVGSDVTFNVTASGTPPFRYQWQFNGTNISNATTSFLTVSNLQFSDAGTYSVEVTNDYGSTNSAGAKLTLLPIAAWGAGKTNANVSPNYGQSIVPFTATNVMALAAGSFHSLALKSDGRVVAWGWNVYSQTNVPSTATNITSILAGERHSLALRSNGTLVAWGNNNYGQTSIPASAAGVTAIGAGWYHNLAITNGKVLAWGAGATVGSSPHFGQSIVPGNLSNVVAVAGGAYHSLALKGDGAVVGWGLNGSGQTTIPVGLSNVIAIAAGSSNSLALKADGTVVGWGNNTFGQTTIPAAMTHVVAISAGGDSCMALSTNGTLFSWGNNSAGQTNVPIGLTNVVAMAAGISHSMALVNGQPLSFLVQPVGFNVTNGARVQFSAAALGSPPISYQWRWHGTNLMGATSATLILTNVQYAHEGPYSVLASNLTGTLSSSNAYLNVYDIGEALNGQLVWTNSATPPWFPETYTTHDGMAAVACGPLVLGQSQSVLGTTVIGPGTITFWWQGTASSMRFFDNGVLKSSFNFGSIWTQRTLQLTPGAHHLTWTALNSVGSTGTAFLDEVTFTPDPEPLRFDISSSYATNNGFMLRLTGLSGHGPLVLYASTNLTNWEPIFTNPPQTGGLQFLDSSDTNQPVRFYRAQEQ